MPQIRNAQGQLVETTEEEIQKLAATQGTPLPASPAAASGIGASPDSAKMAGTPAQKQAVFQQAAQAQPQTLASAQRYDGAARDATEQEKAAQEKVERLQELGSLGTRVQSLVEQKIKAQEAELRVNEQALQDAGLTSSAAQLLQDVINAPPESREAALVQAANALGLETTGAIGSFIEGPAQAVASLGGENVAFTVGELELENKTQIAADLGIDEEALNAMSVDELEQSVRDLEAREYNRVQDLKAQLSTASPAKRQQILRELRSLSYLGVTGLEQELDALEEEVKSGKSVTIGGQTLSLQQVLEDDALSEVLREALEDEDRFEQLQEESPELAEFLDAQRVALEDTLATVKEATSDFASTQQEFDAFVDGVPSTILGAIHGEVPQFVTQAEREEIEAGIKNNGLYQATQQNSDLLLKVQGKPKLAEQLAEFGVDDINNMWEATQDVQQDGMIEALSGIDGDTTDMIVSPAQAMKVLDTKKRLATLSNKVKGNAGIQKAVQDGDLNLDDMKRLDKNPNISVNLYLDNKRVNAQWERAKASDNIEEYLFGPGTTLKEIQTAYRVAKGYKNRSRYREGYDAYSMLDVDGDGRIDAGELRTAGDSLLADKSRTHQAESGVDYGAIRNRLIRSNPDGFMDKFNQEATENALRRKQRELEEDRKRRVAESKKKPKKKKKKYADVRDKKGKLISVDDSRGDRRLKKRDDVVLTTGPTFVTN